MNTKQNFQSLYLKFQSKENKNIVFYLFLIFYTTCLLYFCNKLVIWEDEAYSLNTTAHSLFKVINLSYFFEGQPPVYFVLLNLWLKINDGIFFARLFSVISILLSALVLNKLTKLIFEKFYTKWVIVLFLLNPFTIWISMEIRLYSFLVLLCLLLIYLFYLIYFHNRTKLKFAYVLVGLLGVYTQYYFVFLIISLSILLLVSKGWRSFFNFCLWSLIIAVLFLPNLLFISQQYSMHNTQIAYTWYSRLNNVFDSPLNFWINIYGIQWGTIGRWIMRLIFGVSFLFLLYKLFNENKKHKYSDFKTILQIFIPITFLLILFSIIFLASNLPYSDHYMTILFPLYILVYSVIEVFNKKTKAIIYTIFVTYFVYIFIVNHSSSFVKVIDSKSVANYIQRIERKNEPILFRDKSLVLSFKPYYTGTNPLCPIPALVFNYDYYRSEVKDTIELKHLIDNYTGNHASFLLVSGYDQGFLCEKELSNNIMDNYLKNNHLISIDTVFKGKGENNFLRVRRLNRNQNYSNVSGL